MSPGIALPPSHPTSGNSQSGKMEVSLVSLEKLLKDVTKSICIPFIKEVSPCFPVDAIKITIYKKGTADSSEKEQEVDFIMQENIPIASSSPTELRAELGKRSFIIPENLLETKLQITRTYHTMKNSFSPFTKDETELQYHSKTSSPTLAAVVAAGSVKTPP
ncbi:unnamed protein product [Caretta caretta]